MNASDGRPRASSGPTEEGRRAEPAPAAGDGVFRAIAASARDGIVVLDSKGCIAFMNPAAERIFGHSAAVAIGMDVHRLLAPARYHQAALPAVERFLATGHGPVVGTLQELEAVHLDGTEFPVELSVAALQVDGGWNAVAIVRDISERRRVEAELAAHRERLEELVEARAAALARSERELRIRTRIAEIFLTVADDDMFAEVLEVVLEALASSYGVFGYVDERGDLVVPTMTREVWDRCQVAAKSVVFPRETWGDSSWPRAMRERRANFSNRPSANLPAGHVVIERHVSVPIVHQETSIGLLQVANKATDYSATDLALLEAIAATVAPVLKARLDRDRSLRMLASSEERYRSLVSVLTSAPWTTDPEGRFVEPQDDWAAYTGQSWEEHAGFGWADALHPEDRERVAARWQEALAARTPYRSEGRVWHAASGCYRHFVARAVPLLGEDGSVKEWIGTVTDVDDQKQAEAELTRHRDHLEELVARRTAEVQESELRFRALVEGLHEAAYRMTLPDGRYRYMGPAARHVFGYPRETFETTPGFIAKILHPESVPYFEAALAELMEGSVRAVYEYRVVDPEGGARWIIQSNRGIFDEHGTLVALEGLCRNVTEERRALELLQRQRREQATILDSIPALVFYKDTENRIIRVNQDFAEAMGMERAQLEGRTCFELWPGQAEAYWRDDQEVMATGVAKRGIVEPLATPEGERWLRTDKVPFRDEDGGITGIIGFSVDITERKRAEDAVVELNRRLERRAAELSDANRELEAFSYSVSHDLRSPLRAIDGYSRILLEDQADALDDDGRRVLEQVRASAQEMGVLIDGLLQLSRLGRRSLQTEPVDLARMTRRVFAELVEACPGRDLRLEAGEIPEAHGDPVLLLEVLRNLIGNAVKFSSRRDPAVIEVWGEMERDEKVYHVRDNGAGFDMRYADKLFKVFQRLHLSSDFEGVGIGLALVHRIVSRHGGRVWARGEVDRGATVSFTLPSKGA